MTKNLSWTQRIISGYLAGVSARTLTAPLDTIQTLTQIGGRGKCPLEVLVNTVKNDGILTLWRGNIASCLAQGPQSALKYLITEDLKARIGNGKSLKPWQRFFIGAVAGTISRTAVYPLDVIRVKMISDPGRYPNIFSAFLTTVQKEGFAALFSGLSANIIAMQIRHGFDFYVYDSLRSLYRKRYRREIPAVVNGAIGALSTAAAMTVVYPFDSVRKRMITNRTGPEKTGANVWSVFRSIVKNEGVSGLFRGISVQMVKNVPYGAIQYALQEQIAHFMANWNRHHR